MKHAELTWRELRFKKPGIKISKADLTSAEKEVGKFGDDLREFFLEVNGGTPDKSAFVYEQDGQPHEGRVAWFFEIDGEEESAEESLVEYWEDHHEALPDGMCPIGCDQEHNLIVIGTSGKRKGKVFLWSEGRARGEEPVVGIDGEVIEFPHTESALSPIAKSFAEFIASLRS